MKKLIILKAGSSLPQLTAKQGDFEDWILESLGSFRGDVEVISIYKGQSLPDPERTAGLIITGSHTPVPERVEWSENAGAWLRTAVNQDFPVLGICFGSQLLAHALGGKVADSPAGPEFGTIPIQLNQAGAKDPIFSGLPDNFLIQSAHYQSVIQLPDNTTVLAVSQRDPHSALRFGHQIYGLQFHPEFDRQVTAAYIQENDQRIRSAGDDPRTLQKDSQETTAGNTILKNFLRLCQTFN